MLMCKWVSCSTRLPVKSLNEANRRMMPVHILSLGQMWRTLAQAGTHFRWPEKNAENECMEQKFVCYGTDLKPGPLGWQSSILTAKPPPLSVIICSNLGLASIAKRSRSDRGKVPRFLIHQKYPRSRSLKKIIIRNKKYLEKKPFK